MKPLAIFGTGSDAGKTTLVMALCRLFADQGLKVAPFKAQNVSNNSAVTKEGREISRAQCLQAEAARVEPSYLFNPVLIKSHGNGSVQVIVNGLVHKQQTVTAYYDEIDHLKLQVQQAFSRLQQDYETWGPVNLIYRPGAASTPAIQAEVLNGETAYDILKLPPANAFQFRVDVGSVHKFQHLDNYTYINTINS